jgi:hypothetical protein
VGLIALPVRGEVVVLANRSLEPVTVELLPAGERSQKRILASGAAEPVFFARSLKVRFGEGLAVRQFPLAAANAYFFTGVGTSLELEQIGLGEVPASEVATDNRPEPRASSLRSATIRVRVLVDDNEPTHRRVWEPKLRTRVERASEILARQTGVQLEIVEVATWESDEKQKGFAQILREFERQVKTRPGELAIGFSSQFQVARGRSHLGVTRWPLHSHILLRERSRDLQESERLELLVHELGHYLGASHSPEPQSVMRPVLTRGQQRGVGTRIEFDPVNALLIALVGEEVQRGVQSARALSPSTVQRLQQIYAVLAQALPHDPAARQQRQILEVLARRPAAPRLEAPRPVAEEEAPLVSPLVRDTQTILAQLVAAAEQKPDALTGDALTDHLVRQAAGVAARMRSGNKQRALLLALGIFLDDTDTLRSLPGTGDFLRQVESGTQRSDRMPLQGAPTLVGRSDLLKHFFVSAHLVVVGGKPLSASAGLAKEMADANGGTGFSFVDMAANRAGIAFAEALLAGQLALPQLARQFHGVDYLPVLDGLLEGLTAEQLEADYGGLGGAALTEQLDNLEQRVLNLDVYTSPPNVP